MDSRHQAHRRGNVVHFREKRLEPLPDPGTADGHAFGYVQRLKDETGTADFYWVSVGEVVFDKLVPYVKGRHMGIHVKGPRKGEARGFMEPTSFEDGGGLTILIDAIEEHGRTTPLGRLLVDLALDMRPLGSGGT